MLHLDVLIFLQFYSIRLKIVPFISCLRFSLQAQTHSFDAAVTEKDTLIQEVGVLLIF